MTVRKRRVLAALVVAGSLGATACTSQEPAQPTALSAITPGSESTSSTPATTAPPPSPVPVPAEASALPMPAVGGTDPTVPAANPQEQADRDAIEAVWRKAWALYEVLPDVPETERPALVYTVSTDPIAADVLAAAAKADAAGATFYGRSVLHPYWYRAVAGHDYAVMGDCRDASQFGSKDRATGELLSVGVANSSTVGSFVRNPEAGAWRLFQITYLTNVPCTPHAG